jgi:hypothetical protein
MAYQPPGGPRPDALLPVTDEMLDWLNVGVDKGWVSSPVCSTHDGFPLTENEESWFEDGDDPCVAVVRLWVS